MIKKYENIILVCGFGKKVGKTTLSGLLVRYFKENKRKVYAIKTSSHLHELDEDEVIIGSGEGYAIVKETRDNNKDSSQLLQAGAEESYFIQAKEEFLIDSFNAVYDLIPDDALIVCESGGLREFIDPGLFLFVSGQEVSKNTHFKPLADFEMEFNRNFDNNHIYNIELPLEDFI